MLGLWRYRASNHPNNPSKRWWGKVRSKLIDGGNKNLIFGKDALSKFVFKQENH